jgi:hypothetical protein
MKRALIVISLPFVSAISQHTITQTFSSLRPGLAGFLVWLAMTAVPSHAAAQLLAGVAKVDITNVEAGPVNDPLYVVQSIGIAERVGRENTTSSGMPEFIDVDPGELYLPPSRRQGADPGKFARQIAKHGNSLDGMPALQVVRGKDGHLRINDGVTRATRAAKLRRGALVPAEVIQEIPRLDVTRMPKVKDTLP